MYEEYAILDAQIKALETKKEAMRVDILKAMVEAGKDKEETPVGNFTVSRLKKWTYPEEITVLSEELKSAKAKAESTGEATYTETESLKFTSIKL